MVRKLSTLATIIFALNFENMALFAILKKNRKGSNLKNFRVWILKKGKAKNTQVPAVKKIAVAMKKKLFYIYISIIFWKNME